MINRILIGLNFMISVYNQNVVIDNSLQELSLFKIKNEDQDITIWIRFQSQFIISRYFKHQLPFAIINKATSGQIIFNYEYTKQLDITIKIPKLEYQQKLIQIQNYDRQTWISVQLFKDQELKYVIINDTKFLLPQFNDKIQQYYGNLITWQNITFSLKAYIGKQQQIYSDIFLLKADPFGAINKQIIMDYKDQIQVEMFLRKKYFYQNIILLIRDYQYDYQLIQDFSSVSVQIKSDQEFKTKQFNDISQDEWFKYIIYFEANQTITEIHTSKEEFIWIHENIYVSSIDGYTNYNFGFVIYFLSRFTEIDNVVITNRLQSQNITNNCFPGCKKCIKMECLECEPNLNLSNQCSCDLYQFYSQNFQRCLDISQYEGVIQNFKQIQICKSDEYFNDQKQKCMKCPRIDEYYCTECVFNTELWQVNQTCTFQEILTNIFLNYISINLDFNQTTYYIGFDRYYQEVINEKCEFIVENGLILCKQYDWEVSIQQICNIGQYERVLKRCKTKKGILNNYQHFIMCKQGYVKINQKCLKCPQNCAICEYIFKKIQCLITKEGFYIKPQQQLIKPCKNDSENCLNPQSIQQIDFDLKQNCLLKIKSDCLFCKQDYVLDKNKDCVLGEDANNSYNFEYFPIDFDQLSLQQLMQIAVNQDIVINKSTLQQIQFYGRQYENIGLKTVFTFQNNHKYCLKSINFNQTFKCIKYKNNFTQINKATKINYCANENCTYNLTLNIIIYISNLQKLIYKNNTYDSLKHLLEYLNIQLYLSEIVIMADVYVFSSFDQRCQDQEFFMLQVEFYNQFYQHTQFKLILNFQTVSQFPACWSQYFYSNFQYIEIRNLETSNQLLIQFNSIEVKFINCVFFNKQEVVLIASYILFQNTSFLDSIVNNTLITIYHEDQIQEIKFLFCNFINIFIEAEQIFIYIQSYVQKIIMKNLTVFQVQMFNSSFIYFERFYEFYIEDMDIVELDGILAILFANSQRSVEKEGKIILSGITFSHSEFFSSVFYERDHMIELKNFSIVNCKFYDSFILNIDNIVILNDLIFQQLILDKTSIILYRDKSQNITLKNIKIIDCFLNKTSSLIEIDAYSIIIENILIKNCTYSPPSNILNIKSNFVIIQDLALRNITHFFQSIIMQPNYFLNLEATNIKMSKVVFFNIQIDSVKLLNIQSDEANIRYLKFQFLTLQGGSLNDIIRLSLSYRTVLKVENLQITDVNVKWMTQSQLIYIQGNGGYQSISKIIINNIKSVSELQIFFCSRNYLLINSIKAQFQKQIGFLNQYQSQIHIKNYEQIDDQRLYEQFWGISIFTNINHNSVYEILTISDSSFIFTRQPIIAFQRNYFTNIYIQNVQISQYSPLYDPFVLKVEDIQSNSYKKIYLFQVKYLYFQNQQNNSLQRYLTQKKIFLSCQLSKVILNYIYFVSSNLTIINQYRGRSVQISYIYIQNNDLENSSYFIFNNIYQFIIISSIYFTKQISNCNIFDLKFTNVQEYFDIVTIQNIYINQCHNCSNFLKVQQEGFIVRYNLNHIIIKSSNFNSELINLNSTSNYHINIQNMQIYNTKLLKLVGNISEQVLWNFSLMSFINIIFTQELNKDKVQYYNSYLSNCTYDGQYITIINQSMVLNQNQKLLQQPIALSFQEIYIFNSTKIQEGLYQVHFNKNQTLVYVPTGIPLSKFLYINQITQQYENPYNNFIIILNQFTNEQITCVLNQSINDQQGQYSNMNEFNLKNGLNIIENFTFNMNPYLNYSYIQNDFMCNNITLRFNIKTIPCQLGEYLYQNRCLICDISKNYYSVTRKSQICNIINDYKIEKLKIGNIKIRPGFWRAKQDSNEIEQCNNELCQGGWIPGDQSCIQGFTGALCKECDIYNIRGNGNYAQYDDNCQICELSLKVILKGIFISLWLMFLGFLSYNTNRQITQQYLIFKISKRNVADILMRQSTNQTSIIFKILTNYIFYLYLLKDKLDFLNYKVNISLNLISNPSSQLKPQLDCYLGQINQLEIQYLQLIFSIISPFYTLSLLYLIYFLLLKLKLIQFKFNLILITIYSVYLFNQQLIFQNQIQLLTYTIASNIQWINLNLQFQFHTEFHHHMMYYYIIPSTLVLFLIPGLIYIVLKKVNKRSIKSTKYFGTLFTEYKSESYYWEIVRIYEKYLIIGFLFQFQENFIFFLVQFYLALMIIYQPYALKNLNQLEQKSFYILNSILIIILIITENYDFLRQIMFVSLNLILIYSIIKNLIQKSIIQYRNPITNVQLVLIKKFPFLKGFFNINKHLKLQHHLNVLRNYYQKQKLNFKTLQIHINKISSLANFERLETEIEMVQIKK